MSIKRKFDDSSLKESTIEDLYEYVLEAFYQKHRNNKTEALNYLILAKDIEHTMYTRKHDI